MRTINFQVYHYNVEKLIVAGAGGPASEGVIRSLLEVDPKYHLIGIGADRDDLALSRAHTRYLVPRAVEQSYYSELAKVLEKEKPVFMHAQNDREVLEISRLREDLLQMGTRTFLPKHSTIEVCVDKWKSYSAFRAAGIKVPKNSQIQNEEDLRNAFENLANENGFIWLRSNEVGGGGIGALPTNDYLFAKKWIDHHKGWSKFLAAEILTPNTVTWSSIWDKGKLVVAQTRKRGGWVHGNRTLSGVTGVTKVGQTISSTTVDDIAIATIKSVDSSPHGIFSVDMAYDFEGIPNPTEINIARFFTTIYFFTRAGLNMPEIFVKLALGGEIQLPKRKLNPLQDGLLWFRGMDTEPALMDTTQFADAIIQL
jgi:hypothetical protein